MKIQLLKIKKFLPFKLGFISLGLALFHKKQTYMNGDGNVSVFSRVKRSKIGACYKCYLGSCKPYKNWIRVNICNNISAGNTS